MTATYHEILSWYSSLEKEPGLAGFSEEESRAFREYYSEAGLFSLWKKAFFLEHFTYSFVKMFNYLFSGKTAPIIMDLGSGMGTQSLFFALHGARVISVDVDKSSLSILAKRKAYYERKFSKKLDISIVCRSTLGLDRHELSGIKVDGVFSVFAFNMMKPAQRLLSEISSYTAPRGRVAILDGNNLSWPSKVFPSRRREVLSPPAFLKELEINSFSVSYHSGVVALPPIFWNFNLFGAVSSLDRAIKKDNWFFPISHLIMAEKTAE